jgi:hypothetical protein
VAKPVSAGAGSNDASVRTNAESVSGSAPPAAATTDRTADGPRVTPGDDRRRADIDGAADRAARNGAAVRDGAVGHGAGHPATDRSIPAADRAEAHTPADGDDGTGAPTDDRADTRASTDGERPSADAGRHGGGRGPRRADDPSLRPRHHQIGRASCRGRVS